EICFLRSRGLWRRFQGCGGRYDRGHCRSAGKPLKEKEKMTKKKEQVQIISQEQLAEGIFSMWICTEAAKTAKPGQFLSMYTNDGTKLLPRPISICEID